MNFLWKSLSLSDNRENDSLTFGTCLKVILIYVNLYLRNYLSVLVSIWKRLIIETKNLDFNEIYKRKHVVEATTCQMKNRIHKPSSIAYLFENFSLCHYVNICKRDRKAWLESAQPIGWRFTNLRHESGKFKSDSNATNNSRIVKPQKRLD